MTTQVRATRYVPAMETMEGAGVTVHRTIGTPALRNYDPFMLLDQISSDLSLIHISEPTRPPVASRMPSSA